MYWNPGGVTWGGGHCTVGLPELSTSWYIAEGCTRGFDEYVSIINPDSTAADVRDGNFYGPIRRNY